MELIERAPPAGVAAQRRGDSVEHATSELQLASMEEHPRKGSVQLGVEARVEAISRIEQPFRAPKRALGVPRARPGHVEAGESTVVPDVRLVEAPRFDVLGLHASRVFALHVEVKREVVVRVPIVGVARDGSLVDPDRVVVPSSEAEGLAERVELLGKPNVYLSDIRAPASP